MSALVFPNDGPVVTGMNSVYVSIRKLVSFHQHEIGHGCIHFRSGKGEAVLFFSPEKMVDAFFLDDAGRSSGNSAWQILGRSLEQQSYRISVFTVSPENMGFWSLLNHAKPSGPPLRVSPRNCPG